MIIINFKNGELSIIDTYIQKKMAIQIDEYPYYEDKKIFLEKIICQKNKLEMLKKIKDVLIFIKNFVKIKINWTFDNFDNEDYSEIIKEIQTITTMENMLSNEIIFLQEQNILLKGGYDTLDTIKRASKYLTTIKYKIEKN